MNSEKRIFLVNLLPRIAFFIYAFYPLSENNDAMSYTCVVIPSILITSYILLHLLPPKMSIKQVMDGDKWYLICADFVISLIGIVICLKAGLPKMIIFWGMIIVLGIVKTIEYLIKRKKQI